MYVKEKLVFFTITIGVVVNISSNIVLLNLVGIVGAVIATVLTESLVFMLQLNILSKYKKVLTQ